MKTLYSILLFALFYSTSAVAQINVGDEAPGFSYPFLGGGLADRISLEQHEGKVVYIFFYGANCPHCRSNGPVTETEIHASFKSDTNFVALGLDTWNDSATSNNSFKAVTGITYPLLLNARQSLVDYYGSAGFYDRSIVIGPDGLLKYKGNSFVNGDFEAVKQEIQTQLGMISTSSETVDEFPSSVKLDQNYPNPFNPSTSISFELDKPGEVRLQVFNLLGKEIATLVNETRPAGRQVAIWDANSAPSGMYIYRLTAGDQVLTRRMMLIK